MLADNDGMNTLETGSNVLVAGSIQQNGAVSGLTSATPSQLGLGQSTTTQLLAVGQFVAGSGIPAGTTVASVVTSMSGTSSITLSAPSGTNITAGHNVTLTFFGNNLVLGDNLHNVIFGGPGNDILVGGAGSDDYIQAGSGNETLYAYPNSASWLQGVADAAQHNVQLTPPANPSGSINGNTTKGSNVISGILSTSGLFVGESIVDPNTTSPAIPSNTATPITIAAILSNSSIAISAAATLTTSGELFNVGDPWSEWNLLASQEASLDAQIASLKKLPSPTSAQNAELISLLTEQIQVDTQQSFIDNELIQNLGGQAVLATSLVGGAGDDQLYGSTANATDMTGDNGALPSYTYFYNCTASDTVIGGQGRNNVEVFTGDGAVNGAITLLHNLATGPNNVLVSFNTQGGVLTDGSETITGLTSTAQLVKGETVEGTGILGGGTPTTITAINSSTSITISPAATYTTPTGQTTSLSFGTLVNSGLNINGVGVQTLTGNDTIGVNFGQWAGMNVYVQCGSGTDVVNATSFEGQASLYGGSGNDTFNIGSAIAPGGVYQGGAGQSTLNIQAANDTAGPLFPTTPSPAAATTGGSLASNTYYFRLVAVDPGGTSQASSEVSATVEGVHTNAVQLTWLPFPGATAYQIYAGTSAGNETLYQTDGNVSPVEVNGENVVQYTYKTFSGTSVPGGVPTAVSDSIVVSGTSLTIDGVNETVNNITTLVATGGPGSNIFSINGSVQGAVLRGGAGATNTFTVTGGTDTLVGGSAGTNTFTVTGGTDTLVGGSAGTNTFNVTSATAMITGGSGANDYNLTVPGNDTVVGGSGTNALAIQCDNNSDYLYLSQPAGAAASPITVASYSGNFTVEALGMNSVSATGGPGSDVLNANLMFMPLTLIAGSGVNYLLGGAASNTLYFNGFNSEYDCYDSFYNQPRPAFTGQREYARLPFQRRAEHHAAK